MDNESNCERVPSENTTYEEADVAHGHTDVSDETCEVCDKTASDPDSPRLRDMHNNAKEGFIADIKPRQERPPSNYDADFPALQRLLHELTTEEEKLLLENESPLKIVDVLPPSTILDDYCSDILTSCQKKTADELIKSKPSPDDLIDFSEPICEQAIDIKESGESDSESEEELLIEISDDETDDVPNLGCKLDAENIEENARLFSPDGSFHFNDTLEEVDYMMRKGMEYIAAAKQALQRTAPSTPVQKQNIDTPEPSKEIMPTAVSSLKSASISNDVIKNIEPKYGVKLTKTAKGSVSRIPKQKSLRDRFAHIASPVSAYIKKTKTTPLMVRHHCTNANANVHNATVFRELDLETRRQLFSDDENIDPFVVKSSIEPRDLAMLPNKCPLPRKHYKASEYKHYMDDRTQITIPGGQMIGKYLMAPALPLVMRHDGKIKLDNIENSDQGASGSAGGASSRIPPQSEPNSSIADMSVTDGEISLYTIKDAHKF